MYSLSSLAIPLGPFAEDPEQIEAFLNEIVNDLDPRDSVEAAHAHRIALLHLQEHRMDHWEAASLNSVVRRTSPPQLLVANNYEYPLIGHIAEWNMERLPDDPAIRDTYTMGDERERPWDLMADYLRSRAALGVTLENLWDESNTPRSAGQWWRAFEVVAKHVFPEPRDLASWLMRRNAILADSEEEMLEQERHEAADLSIRFMPAVLTQRA